ncbi:hypothetical protein XarbCFBP6827_19830 [Xanthomonas arboricola]|nr:hypothetical protein XarbCFBP6827_19830 [Xanthomonas arboricola]
MFAHKTWTFTCSLLRSGEGAPNGADEGTGEALWSLGAGGLRLAPHPNPLPGGEGSAGHFSHREKVPRRGG